LVSAFLHNAGLAMDLYGNPPGYGDLEYPARQLFLLGTEFLEPTAQTSLCEYVPCPGDLAMDLRDNLPGYGDLEYPTGHPFLPGTEFLEPTVQPPMCEYVWRPEDDAQFAALDDKYLQGQNSQITVRLQCKTHGLQEIKGYRPHKHKHKHKKKAKVADGASYSVQDNNSVTIPIPIAQSDGEECLLAFCFISKECFVGVTDHSGQLLCPNQKCKAHNPPVLCAKVTKCGKSCNGTICLQFCWRSNSPNLSWNWSCPEKRNHSTQDEQRKMLANMSASSVLTLPLAPSFSSIFCEHQPGEQDDYYISCLDENYLAKQYGNIVVRAFCKSHGEQTIRGYRLQKRTNALECNYVAIPFVKSDAPECFLSFCFVSKHFYIERHALSGGQESTDSKCMTYASGKKCDRLKENGEPCGSEKHASLVHCSREKKTSFKWIFRCPTDQKHATTINRRKGASKRKPVSGAATN